MTGYVNWMKIIRPYQQACVNEVITHLKYSNGPILLMASVGAGKSLMIAEILLKLTLDNSRALCLVNNAELVRNNWETYLNQGGKAGIYCAALYKKETKKNVIFATPQSIIRGLNKDIGQIKFDLIIVDEAHSINYLNKSSSFMRILIHYAALNPQLSLLGATGTDFRYKGTSIVGEECLFKKKVGNIETHWLIENNYLVRPTFEISTPSIDFSHVKLNSMGKFDSKQLDETINKNTRLTEIICEELIRIMESTNRQGVFIFATTKKHAYEILSHLPPDESAIILGETTHNERSEILYRARHGTIKYLVNIAIISVGVDVPRFDTIAYLRPTESLVLMVQTMGRALRLYPNKSDALILDFAGNIERHAHWDNPIILDAIKQTIDKDEPYIITCPKCMSLNTLKARRCIGLEGNNLFLDLQSVGSNSPHQVRCNYYFSFKECTNSVCKAQNDLSARECRICKVELIDPNAALNLAPLYNQHLTLKVLEAKYSITRYRGDFTIHAAYKCEHPELDKSNPWMYESFTPNSAKAKNYFYAKFIRLHCKNPSQYYRKLSYIDAMNDMLQKVNTPKDVIAKNVAGMLKIVNKVF